jgi:hypothetical protein
VLYSKEKQEINTAMKITYETIFNFGFPAGTKLPEDMPIPTTNVELRGSVELTPEEYQACLAATMQAAKEAADVWRPIAVDIVKSAFLNTSFKEFCSLFWQKAKNMIGGGVFAYRAPEE